MMVPHQRRIRGVMAKALWLFGLSAAVTLAGTPDRAVTYNRDVAPIMQQHCQECHRAGEIAPMSLMSYKEVRPYAAAIKEAVALRKMPPWFADPHYGKFANDRGLSQADVDTLVKWVNSGAHEGEAADLPAPRKFLEGWNIEKPNVVLEMPGAFSVPASGTIAYQHYLI